MPLPDYSEWVVGEKVGVEERAWSTSQLHMNYVAHICYLRSKYPIFKILELGCGSGWVPTQLGLDIKYTGVDKNEQLLALCELKNGPTRRFFKADIRNFDIIRAMHGDTTPDLVCSFAVLKHFALEEFEEIFTSMLHHAPIGLFSMNFADENRNDGLEFNHIWITYEWLKEILDKNEFELLYKTTVWNGKTWEHKTGEEVIFGVKRR